VAELLRIELLGGFSVTVGSRAVSDDADYTVSKLYGMLEGWREPRPYIRIVPQPH
jgi:hypothetical protein